ncbi:MAG: cytochrome ubiquinol oxidase subunit I [Chloroflexi bacterium]|nr:cytochrome ubiquinol oxidase subunit I [Chloroflexota bacterium]
MDALFLARLQFSIVTVYHWFFVPLTLGFSILLAIMETIYVRTGDEKYKRMTKYFGTLFLINFAIGVATGIVQEFQFGMNWSQYSRFVGDIFGVPLAIEALLAFFMESTFLGIWIFGWEKLSKKMHLATIWLVALGSNLSAIWILVANSWMQEPVGYKLEGGRAVMTDFLAVATNPHIFYQFPHVFFSGMATTGFFVAGVAAWHLLRRKKDAELFSQALKMAIIYGFIGTLLVATTGHTQGQHMVEAQPMKMAAAEALWNSEQPAALSLFTIGDMKNREDIFAIKIPRLLSFLSCNNFSCEVKGMNQLQAEYEQKYGPGNYIPNSMLAYWNFRIMVGAGTLMLLLVLHGLWLMFKKQDFRQHTTFLLATVWALFLPYFANATGWLFTELARQPWVVFGLMRTEEGVSNTVPASWVLLSLVTYTLLYAVLIVADVYLLLKYARKDPDDESQAESSDTPAPSLVGA